MLLFAKNIACRWRNMGCWWNGTDRGKPNSSERSLPQRDSCLYKSQMLWNVIEHRPLRWEAGDLLPEPCHVIDWVVRTPPPPPSFYPRTPGRENDALTTRLHYIMCFTAPSAAHIGVSFRWLPDVGTPVASWSSARTPRSCVPVSSANIANFALRIHNVSLNCLMSAAEQILFFLNLTFQNMLSKRC
jgi:hypothetical protein